MKSYLAWLQEPGSHWASWQRGLWACPALRRGASYHLGPPSLWGAIQQRDNMQIRIRIIKQQWDINKPNPSKIDELKGVLLHYFEHLLTMIKILSTPDSFAQFLMTSKSSLLVHILEHHNRLQ